MINIKVFFDALVLTWLRRLITYDSKWQHFIKSYIDLNKLMGCHLNYIEHCKKKSQKSILGGCLKCIHKN